MAKCKWCEKGSLFQKVDGEGLCTTCSPSVHAEIERLSNVIYEAMHVYERATDPAERLRECERVLSSAQTLAGYEDKGLTTCSPPAKLLVGEYREYRDQCRKA
jgi:hypothetical protein